MTHPMLPTEYLETLRAQGGRITTVVTSVLNHLYQSQTIHSPQKLREDISKELSTNVGFPTIYRILDRLTEAGLVQRMHQHNNQSYFFLCRHPGHKHHHHFICNKCDSVQEIDLCLADTFKKHVKNKLGAMMTEHIVQIEGVCQQCIKKAR